MNRRAHILLQTGSLSALLVLFLGTAQPSIAQEETREVQVSFDSLSVRTVGDRTISDWLRPVFIQDEFRLKARNGMDEGTGFIRFWGDVEIIEKGDTIRADRVRYQKETKIGLAEGNVSLTDGSVVLRAPSATYFSNEERTAFVDGVTYEDSAATLVAQQAVYMSKENRATFSQQVVLTQEDMTVNADSVVHLRESGESWAWGHIAALRASMEDSIRVFMVADSLFRDAGRDLVVVSGSARLARLDDAAQDSVFMVASRFTIRPDGSMTAVDSVVVSAPSYDLRADSLTTQDSSNDRTEARIFGQPMAWVQDTQMRSDDLRITSGALADSIFGVGNVFVATPDSMSGRTNQLRGQTLIAVMVADSLRSLAISDNAEAVFFFESEENGGSVGAKASGDGMTFTFTAGALDRVAFYEGVEGTYYSGALLDQLANLPGFIFTPEDRPNRRRTGAQFWDAYLERTTVSSSR